MGNNRKRLWKPHTFSKPNPIKRNENLDNHGFESKDSDNKCLESLIRFGVPCQICNAWYLKEWKIRESF